MAYATVSFLFNGEASATLLPTVTRMEVLCFDDDDGGRPSTTIQTEMIASTLLVGSDHGQVNDDHGSTRGDEEE